MARPAKTLQERVRDGSFLARRHGGLLAGPLVGPERLREIQAGWQAATSERLQRALALEYQQAVGGAPAVASATSSVPVDVSLPVARFFPAMFSHVKGPSAGRPFKLEAWQRRFVEEFSRVNGDGRVYRRGMLGVARGTVRARWRRGWRYASLCSPGTSRM